MTDITPARLRELAEREELRAEALREYEALLRECRNPKVADEKAAEAARSEETAAALRAAADYIDRLLELRASDAQMIGDAHGLVRAREALLVRAGDAINNAMLNPVHGIVDKVLYTRIAMSKPHYESARALAAEIAEALKGGGDE